MHALEWKQIQETLGAHCSTSFGKEMAVALQPSFDKNTILHTLQETEEAQTLCFRLSNPPIGEVPDIRKSLAFLRSHSHLTPSSLLEIAQVFQLATDLKQYFFCDIVETEQFPILAEKFSLLYTNAEVYKKITDAIIEENTIADTASPNLNRLRRTLRTLESGIREKLNTFIHSATYSKYIMEPIVTIRNSRFVIPIKEEYRSQVKGFIHDVSSSGSTVFMEPISVFELNNRLNRVRAEETVEIEKILTNLSEEVFPYIDRLEKNLELFCYLDFVFAKAKYAKDIDAAKPEIVEEKILSLEHARHPMIAKEVAVPVDITLGKEYTTLVITGPNTGGKTVALKTVGLLCLMTYAGLFIPASSKSKVCIFDNVFVDIGDEQSIQASLSTFSSHMVTIRQIIEKSTSSSLILLDELGSGTDPEEGECLAISLLEYFHNKGALTMATTHYSGLKKFALLTPGFKNASFEFDVATLTPTYRFLMGVPGKSNAFEICERLGIPTPILEAARSKRQVDALQFEDMVRTLQEDSLRVAENREQSEKYVQELLAEKEAVEQEKWKLQHLREEKLETSKAQAREILLQAQEEANRIIATLNATQNLSEANKIRSDLHHTIQDITKSMTTKEEEKESADTEITVGSTVLVRSLGQIGEVRTKPNKSGQVQVQIGMAKMHVKYQDLELQSKPATSPKMTLQSFHASTSTKSKSIASEINVIGSTVEEAIFVLDKYLDDAVLAGLPSVRIVHGKGSRKTTRRYSQFLKNTCPCKSI